MSINVDANRFDYQKQSTSDASPAVSSGNNLCVNVYLEDSIGKTTKRLKHAFNHRKLQDKLFLKIKPQRRSESDVDYERRIKYITDEYEQILQKISTS